MFKKVTMVGCCFLAISPAACSDPTGAAETAVRNLLSDPGSAEFRNVTQKGEVMCGEVNSRNQMGGYVGFRRFYVEGRGTGTAVVDPRAWASADTIRIFGRDLLTPNNDTGEFEAVFERVCS